jgi:hypothetical protein
MFQRKYYLHTAQRQHSVNIQVSDKLFQTRVIAYGKYFSLMQNHIILQRMKFIRIMRTVWGHTSQVNMLYLCYKDQLVNAV